MRFRGGFRWRRLTRKTRSGRTWKSLSDFHSLNLRSQIDELLVDHFVTAVDVESAKLPFKVTPHMLRHSCGFHLANRGCDTRLIQDYLEVLQLCRSALMSLGRYGGYTRQAAIGPNKQPA